MKFLNRFFLINDLKKDIAFLAITIMVPFLFFVYKIVPESRIWKTKLFMLDSNIFDNAKYCMWYFSAKFLTLTILIIWYLSCKYEWKYVLFIPIFLELVKVHNVVQTVSLGLNYKPNYLKISIINLIFLLVLFLISKRFGYYKKESKFFDVDLEKRKDLLLASKIDQKEILKVRRDLFELMNKKEKMRRKNYLINLIQLRDSLTKI